MNEIEHELWIDRASRQSYEEKNRVNDEIIMKCLVTMILELLLQTFGMVHACALTQIKNTLRFF
jgi:hypothetical protein